MFGKHYNKQQNVINMKQLELGEKYYTSAQSNIHVILPFINSTTSKDKYIYIYQDKANDDFLADFWLHQ